MINLDKYSRIDLFQWLSQFCKTFRDKVDVLLEEGKQIMIEELKACEARANDATETHATKTENPTEVAPQTGGVSSPVLCSGSSEVSDKQVPQHESSECSDRIMRWDRNTSPLYNR